MITVITNKKNWILEISESNLSRFQREQEQ